MNCSDFHTPDLPLSVAEQVDFLLRSGITIQNRDEAERILSHVSFHRLRGYWEPLYARPESGAAVSGHEGVTFADIMERYNFDHDLRKLMMDAFDHIEISLRTRCAYVLAYECGEGRFAYRDSTLFGKLHTENLDALRNGYIKFAGKKYDYLFDYCPIWSIAETMSFGQLSTWYFDTRRPARCAVAVCYEMAENVLKSLLPHLRTIRNMCAHYERLWDRTLVSRSKTPNRMGYNKETGLIFSHGARNKIYNALVMVAYLISRINPNTEWHHRLVDLLNRYDSTPLDAMGFPADWEQRVAALGLPQ